MKKGQEYETIIEGYEFPNKGIAYIENRKVVIKGAFLGQRVQIRITKKKENSAEGRLLCVLEKSADESATPFCAHFGECGGCMYQMYPYETQLRIKEKQVLDLIGGVGEDLFADDYVWEGILRSPHEQCYRNKMEFSFGDACKDGELTLGLHKKGSFYDVLELRECKLVSEDYTKILQVTLAHFRALGIPYYRKMQHVGCLRHLVVRRSEKSGEILLNLVVSSKVEGIGSLKAYLHISEWVEKLNSLELSGKIAGAILTLNDSLADVVQADATELLFGRDYIEEELLGLTFRITPFSFFQTNSLGAEVLYSKAREYVGETNSRVIFDLYSGTGTIAQILAPVAKKVVGVEIVEEAVEAARFNAGLNGLANCEFVAGDVLKVIDSLTDKPDILVLDPPRDGIHPKALPKLIRYGVERIVYISCKPTSLARDLVTLKEAGYRVERACCVDMFPQTPNVETVCLLSNAHKATITLDVEMEDYHRIKGDRTYDRKYDGN